MSASNKRLIGFCAASVLLMLSASVCADTSVGCDYQLLTGSYYYLAACSVEISPERYETYKRLRTALEDFINSNSAPGKPGIDRTYEESRQERARLNAETEKCQGESRQFTEYIFQLLTTEESATRLLGKLSNPRDPWEGDCL